MNRRTFLKTIGLAIAAPGAVLGAVKATVSSGFNLKAAMEIVGKIPRISHEYYYLFVYPKQFYALKVATARAKYEHERWLIRHNRWLEKQGKPPIEYKNPQYGSWDGVRIIETKRLVENA